MKHSTIRRCHVPRRHRVIRKIVKTVLFVRLCFRRTID